MKAGIDRRVIVIAAIAIAIAVAGAGLLWLQRTGDADAPLRLYGNVDIREVQLAFRQPGRVAHMMFDEGDAVAAGARMASLDPQPYREAFAAADAAVQIAEAELGKLRLRFNGPALSAQLGDVRQPCGGSAFDFFPNRR